LARSRYTSQPIAIAGAESNAQDMPSPATCPLLFPGQFTQVTGALIVLAVGLALLVVVGVLATHAAIDTKNQNRGRSA
jgi:hypothetical protein